MIKVIIDQIKRRILENKLSVNALAKKAGIPTSSLQNILNGRSKNPGIENLKVISKALNCQVADLIGERVPSPLLEKLLENSDWTPEIYIQAWCAVCDSHKRTPLLLSKINMLEVVEEVYKYCLKYKKSEIDSDFVDWVITQALIADKH